jgi:dihydrofolate reductase
MHKLVVTEFITLDGVIEDPGGAEGFQHGGWSFKFQDPEGMRFKLDELMAADVQLLGRVTYEGFAKAWPGMERDEAGFADKMNGMPKVVVSATLTEATWQNSEIVRPDDLAAKVAELKEGGDGDILVAGSATLVRALAALDLVDRYNLMVFPVALGSGKRLFDGIERPATLRLASAQQLASGTQILTYESARG